MILVFLLCLALAQQCCAQTQPPTVVTNAKELAAALSSYRIQNIAIVGEHCKDQYYLLPMPQATSCPVLKCLRKCCCLPGTITLTPTTWKPIGGTITVVDRYVQIGAGDAHVTRMIIPLHCVCCLATCEWTLPSWTQIDWVHVSVQPLTTRNRQCWIWVKWWTLSWLAIGALLYCSI